VWGAISAGGVLFAQRVVEPRAEHDPAAVLVGVVVAVSLGFCVYFAQWCVVERRRTEWRRRPAGAGGEPTQNRAWVAPLILLGVIVVLFGLQAGKDTRSHEITYYCSYGAVSDRQLEECEDNVSSSYVRSLNTDAARFAEGQLERCLSDAGPFCAQSLTSKREEEEASAAE
jgi:hypothetical protein